MTIKPVKASHVIL